MAILEVKNLRKSFRNEWLVLGPEVLKGISFSVEPGTVTGFLGANGAGKTTTIKCMLRLIHQTSGEILFFGKKDFNSETKKRIGFLPERPYFYDYLTGYEFLKFYGQLSQAYNSSQLKERIQFLLKRVRLEFAKDRLLRDYSKGMLQRVGLAQALIHRPEFIILDEPMSGLDPDGRYEVREIIQETASEGTAVFFSSHLLHDAEKICDQLVVLKEGATVYSGATEELLRKFPSKTVVSFLSDGERKSREVFDGENLNGVIDELRSKKLDIVEINTERPSLEKAFVQMAYGDMRADEI